MKLLLTSAGLKNNNIALALSDLSKRPLTELNRPVAHLPPTLVAPFFTLSFLIPHFQMKIPHTTRYLHDQIIKVCPPVT